MRPIHCCETHMDLVFYLIADIVILRNQWKRSNIGDVRTCAECGQKCLNDKMRQIKKYLKKIKNGGCTN